MQNSSVGRLVGARNGAARFSRFPDRETIRKTRTFKIMRISARLKPCPSDCGIHRVLLRRARKPCPSDCGIHRVLLRRARKPCPSDCGILAYWPRRAGPERLAPGRELLMRPRPPELRPAERPEPGRLRKPLRPFPLCGPALLDWVWAD